MELDFTNVSATGVTAGTHTCTIASVELKDTKAGNGKYYSVAFQPDEGQRFYNMYTVVNPNATAVQIGMVELKKLINAAGLDVSGKVSPDSLVGLKVELTVALESDSYGDKVKIKKYAKAADAGNIAF